MNPKFIASAKENKITNDKPAIRFTINLGESNENTCPEISYRDIYKESLEKKKQSIDSNEVLDLDILQKEDEKNEDERITAIVKNLEARYGVQGGKGKTKKMRNKIADLMDMGIGYDESDSFIDNSEAYDELVPSTMTTKLGGFYINSGVLEYKEIRSSSDDEKSVEHHSHGKHHHPLSGHAHAKQARAAMNRKNASINNGRSLLKKSLSLSAVKSHKNLNNGNRSRHYLSLAKHNKKQFKKAVVDGKVKYLVATSSDTVQTPESTQQMGEKTMGRSNSESFLKNSQSPLEPSRNDKNSLSQPGETAKKLSKKLNKLSMQNSSNSSLNSFPTAKNNDIASVVKNEQEALNAPAKEPKILPPLNLGPEIKELLDELIQLGNQPKSDRSTARFFTPRVNSILLRIENLTRKTMTFGQRSRLYHMLTGQLPCTRDTLVKKAKRIWLEDRQTKMDLTMGLFKKALSNAYAKTTLALHPDEAENYKESAIKYLKQVILLRLECLDRHKMSQVPLSGNSLNMVDESLKLYVKQEIDSMRATLNINVEEQFTKSLLDMVRVVISSYFAHSYHAKFHKYPPSTLPILPSSIVENEDIAKVSVAFHPSPITTTTAIERHQHVSTALPLPSPSNNSSSSNNQSIDLSVKRKIKPTPITTPTCPSGSVSSQQQQVNNFFKDGPASLTPPFDVKERYSSGKVKFTPSKGDVINNVEPDRGNVIALSPSPPPAKRQDCRATPSAVATMSSSPNPQRPEPSPLSKSTSHFWPRDGIQESHTISASLPNDNKSSSACHTNFPYTSIHPNIIFPHVPSSHPLLQQHYVSPPIFPFQPPGPGKQGGQHPNHDELSTFIFKAIQKELHKSSPTPSQSSRKQQHLLPGPPGFLHPFSLSNILSPQSLPVQPARPPENIPLSLSSSSIKNAIVLPKAPTAQTKTVLKGDNGQPGSNNNEHCLITLDDE